jgi:hypothetical protein
MSGFQMLRLGVAMDPERGNPLESEGVLNPAAVRGPDGQLYPFPRLVARGNYSRIGIARVQVDGAGIRATRNRMIANYFFCGVRPGRCSRDSYGRDVGEREQGLRRRS